MSVESDKQHPIANLLVKYTWQIGASFVFAFYILHALFEVYAQASLGPWEEFWLTLEHIVWTLAILLVFKGIESKLDFKDTSEHYLAEISRMLKGNRDEFRDAILPLSSTWGLIGARPGINFLEIFKEAKPGSNIQIFFTFHPSLSDDLAEIAKIINEKNIYLRLLIGSPDADSIKRRFKYIGWLGHDGRDPTYIDRLRNFILVEVPKMQREYRPVEKRDMLRVRTFSYLPDLPIVIESSPATPPRTLDETRDDRVPQIVRRVFTGFYVLQPAVHSLLLEWRSVHPDSLANAFLDYFEVRWSDAVDTYRTP